MEQTKHLVHKKERNYFGLVLFISLVIYIVLCLSVIGLLVLFLFFIISMFFHGIMIGYIRTNGVKVTEEQFPAVHQKVQDLCVQMGIDKVPDVYVVESSGILNAFATRFFGKNMVVLYSEVFELTESEAEDELVFIIAHELAHIKRNHLLKHSFILPAMWIPGLGELYLRACEFTCDRYAVFYCGNPEAAKNSLTILAVGKKLYKRVNREAYLKQMEKEKGFFAWLSEILSSHPPLPKRIYEVMRFLEEKEMDLKSSKWGYIFLAGTVAAAVLFTAGISFFVKQMEKLGESMIFAEDEEVSLEEGENPEKPEIIQSVIYGNTDEVKQLIKEGKDLNEKDSEGMAAIHWAALAGNEEMVLLLLQNGANIDETDDYMMTPLMEAAQNGHLNVAEQLLLHGSDPNAEDADGMTPLFYGVMSNRPEIVKLLLDAGADPIKTDYAGDTPLVYAIRQQPQNRVIIDMLRKEMR